MTDSQIEIVNRLLNEGQPVHWIDLDNKYRQITCITDRSDEPGPVAYFANGEYVALWNCEFSQFGISIGLEEHLNNS